MKSFLTMLFYFTATIIMLGGTIIGFNHLYSMYPNDGTLAILVIIGILAVFGLIMFVSYKVHNL